MYTIGDRVLYGAHGICRIIGFDKRTVDKKTLEFYVLEPVEMAGTRFYVPTQNPAALAKLKPVLSKEELLTLLHGEEIRRNLWIEDEKARKQYYRDLLSAGDRTDILCMMYSVYLCRKTRQESGVKLHIADTNFLRDARKLLCNEFSAVLKIPKESVGEYIEIVLTK